MEKKNFLYFILIIAAFFALLYIGIAYTGQAVGPTRSSQGNMYYAFYIVIISFFMALIIYFMNKKGHVHGR